MVWGDYLSFEYGKPVKDKQSIDGNVPVFGTNGQIGTSHLPPLCKIPSFVVGRKGAYRGVHYSSVPFSVIDTAFYALPLTDKVDLKWAYYKFLTYDINRMDSGSAIPSTDRYELYKIEVEIPSLETQKKIVSVLDVFENIIRVNSEINENLLQQASTIYKAWFDDFIPFDGICPAEWEQGVLSDIADITSGKRPPMKSAEKTSIATVPLVGAASVMGFTSEANHTDKILVTGRVGTHGVVQRFNTPCWTSDNTLVITSAFYEYTYQILQRIDYHAMNRGSTQPLITQGDMNKVVILIPDRQTLDDFEALVGLLMSQYEANLLENTKLAKLRDALLPKLMSGELDVSDLDI